MWAAVLIVPCRCWPTWRSCGIDPRIRSRAAVTLVEGQVRRRERRTVERLPAESSARSRSVAETRRPLRSRRATAFGSLIATVRGRPPRTATTRRSRRPRTRSTAVIRARSSARRRSRTALRVRGARSQLSRSRGAVTSRGRPARGAAGARRWAPARRRRRDELDPARDRRGPGGVDGEQHVVAGRCERGVGREPHVDRLPGRPGDLQLHVPLVHVGGVRDGRGGDEHGAGGVAGREPQPRDVAVVGAPRRLADHGPRRRVVAVEEVRRRIELAFVDRAVRRGPRVGQVADVPVVVAGRQHAPVWEQRGHRVIGAPLGLRRPEPPCVVGAGVQQLDALERLVAAGVGVLRPRVQGGVPAGRDARGAGACPAADRGERAVGQDHDVAVGARDVQRRTSGEAAQRGAAAATSITSASRRAPKSPA